ATALLLQPVPATVVYEQLTEGSRGRSHDVRVSGIVDRPLCDDFPDRADLLRDVLVVLATEYVVLGFAACGVLLRLAGREVPRSPIEFRDPLLPDLGQREPQQSRRREPRTELVRDEQVRDSGDRYRRNERPHAQQGHTARLVAALRHSADEDAAIVAPRRVCVYNAMPDHPAS